MSDLIEQHLAALKAEEQRAQKALALAQRQVQELSVACLKLQGGREALELVLGATQGGNEEVGDTGLPAVENSLVGRHNGENR